MRFAALGVLALATGCANQVVVRPNAVAHLAEAGPDASVHVQTLDGEDEVISGNESVTLVPRLPGAPVEVLEPPIHWFRWEGVVWVSTADHPPVPLDAFAHAVVEPQSSGQGAFIALLCVVGGLTLFLVSGTGPVGHAVRQ